MLNADTFSGINLATLSIGKPLYSSVNNQGETLPCLNQQTLMQCISASYTIIWAGAASIQNFFLPLLSFLVYTNVFSLFLFGCLHSIKDFLLYLSAAFDLNYKKNQHIVLGHSKSLISLSIILSVFESRFHYHANRNSFFIQTDQCLVFCELSHATIKFIKRYTAREIHIVQTSYYYHKR